VGGEVVCSATASPIDGLLVARRTARHLPPQWPVEAVIDAEMNSFTDNDLRT